MKEQNKRVKVLQVVPLGTGGVTSLVLNIAESIDKDKVAFDYLTFYDRKEFAEERALACGGKKYVVPIDHYSNPVIRALFKFFYAIKVIRSCNPDVLHLNTSQPYEVLVGISAKLAGTKKVFFHSHNSSTEKKSVTSQIVNACCKKIIPFISDCNLACSFLAAEYMYTKKVVKEKNYILIKNGIQTDKYKFSNSIRNEYRSKLGLEDKIVIGHIGRFTKQKNHKFMVDIFEQIHKKNPKTVLLLIGVGELFDEIQCYVKNKNLDQSIIFYGATTEVPKLLQAMDCFLFPSLYEGLPVAGVEVQAAGLPIIMSDTITRELDIAGLATYVSLEESADKWADIVLEVCRQKIDRESKADAVKKAGFDIKETADMLTKLYIAETEK